MYIHEPNYYPHIPNQGRFIWLRLSASEYKKKFRFTEPIFLIKLQSRKLTNMVTVKIILFTYCVDNDKSSDVCLQNNSLKLLKTCLFGNNVTKMNK